VREQEITDTIRPSSANTKKEMNRSFNHQKKEKEKGKHNPVNNKLVDQSQSYSNMHHVTRGETQNTQMNNWSELDERKRKIVNN